MDAAIWRVYRSLGEDFTDSLDNERIVSLLTEFVPDVGGDILEAVERVKEDRSTLAQLLNLPSVAQRSEEWFNLRKERLTASDAHKALINNRTRDILVRNKAFPAEAKFIDTAATRWGKVFEPMALRIYRARNAQVVVHDFGLIPHPTLSCFGASPDGITATGIMVEIKCPYSREIKPGYIPEYYEIQMQGQMAVCGLSRCDYIECKLIRHDTETAFAGAARRCKYPEDHGVVTIDANGDALEYSPSHMTPSECIDWKKDKSDATIMWTLGLVQVQHVTFDSARWDTMVPKFRQFWADVLALRASSAGTGTRVVGAKDKKVVSFIDSDSD